MIWKFLALLMFFTAEAALALNCKTMVDPFNPVSNLEEAEALANTYERLGEESFNEELSDSLNNMAILSEKCAEKIKN